MIAVGRGVAKAYKGGFSGENITVVHIVCELLHSFYTICFAFAVIYKVCNDFNLLKSSLYVAVIWMISCCNSKQVS